MKKVDAGKYGLKKNNKIYETNGGEIAIVKDRKSRIIMKDGYKIVEVAEKIKVEEPNKIIIFLSTAPVCSKTKAFLEKNGILTKRVNVY